MSLRIRFRFDGKCSRHPRYDPTNNGRPSDSSCPGCESLYVVWLYTDIARRKGGNGDGLVRHVESAEHGTPSQSVPVEEAVGATASTPSPDEREP